MAAALRPKVRAPGAVAVLAERPPGGFLVGSSINAFFGGASDGAPTAAANACLEGFFDALANRAGRGPPACLSHVGRGWLSRGYAMAKLSAPAVTR